MRRSIASVIAIAAILPVVALAEGLTGIAVGMPAAETQVQGVKLSPTSFDGTLADDDIVQVNGLRIDEITNDNGAVLLWSSGDRGAGCIKYPSLSSARATAFPCPLSAEQFYQIRIDGDTSLLLRTRAKARLSDIEIGDRVNVYGYMDRDTHTIEAMIVRDLDKPVRVQYIQLNAANIVSINGRDITVEQPVVSPCYDYSAGGAAMPCPMGVRPAETKRMNAADAAAEGSQAMYFPMPRTYIVHVPVSARIMDASRKTLLFSSLQIGDSVNVYGSMRTGDSTITAMVVRDLRITEISSARLELEVTDGAIRCIKAPCGVVYNAKAVLYSAAGAIAGSGETASGKAIFTNIAPGNYTAVITVPGYEDVKVPVTMPEQGVQYYPIQLYRLEQPQALSFNISTDKQIYAEGEPVYITFGVYNGSDREQVLQFTSGCVASYLIDDIYDSSAHTLCMMMLRSETIAAHSWFQVQLRHEAAQYPLKPGDHTISVNMAPYGGAKTLITVR